MKLTAQEREQARFAAAVGTDKTDAPARMNLQCRVFDQPTRATRERKVTELNQAEFRRKARILAESAVSRARDGTLRLSRVEPVKSPLRAGYEMELWGKVVRDATISATP
jgi:hypothetical protein